MMSQEVVVGLRHSVFLLFFLIILELLFLYLFRKLREVFPYGYDKIQSLIVLRAKLVQLRVLPVSILIHVLVTLHCLLAEQFCVTFVAFFKCN